MAPIFGMPEDSSSGSPRPSLEPTARRQPPPRQPTPGDVSGPPSITLDDGLHNEFDLGGGGASLELDLAGGPGSSAPPPAEPPPAIGLPDESGLDFPTPVTLRPGDSGLDIPADFNPARESEDFSLDLPAPAPPKSDLPQPVAPRPSVPPPPSRPPGGGSFAPPPRPGPPPAGPPPAGPPPAGPPPAGAPPPGPPPASAFAPPPAPDLPSFDDDLPAPVELDLPAPAGAASVGPEDGLDLPTPAGAAPASAQPEDRLDLPIPLDLPTPGGQGQMLTPSGQDVAPATMDVEPSDLGVTPAPLDLSPAMPPANLEEQPIPTPVGTPGIEVGGPSASAPPDSSAPTDLPPTPATASPTAPKGASPTPAKPPRPPVSRGLLLGVGGLVLVGLAGIGVLYSGLLDPDPQPAVRGAGGTKTKTDGKGDGTTTTPKSDGAAAERDSAVLAIMAKHAPADYLQARATLTEAGDGVGAAECSLLLHFHYGPSPSLTEAQAALQPHGGNPAGFVQRVIGLNALALGKFEAADKALAGDEPRTRLYRGWLRLAEGKLDEAQAEADAVLGTLADEVSAQHLSLSIKVKRDPAAAVAALQVAISKNPHPAFQALLAEAGVETGLLAIARTAVDTLDPASVDDPGVQAWIHTQHANVRAAQGDYGEALAAYDRALALVPKAPAVQAARIRTLLQAKRFNDASTSTSAFVREQPKDVDAQLLQAEVAIESGDGDIALRVLDTLAKSLPKDARVMRLKGEVHAMRLEVDEGQTAFAAARALDPADYKATVGEAILLSDAKRLPDALSVIETARAEAEAAGRTRDVVKLLVTKARLHHKAGERNAARETVDKALGVLATDNDAQLLRGTLRVADGKLADGRADLVAVFERTGGYPGLAAPLGQLFVLEGDFESLERLIGDRVRGDQTPDDLLVVGIRLRLHQSRNDDARSLVEYALTRRPTDWELHMLKAQLLINEGKAAEALAQIERSRPADPQPELMLQRGKILEYNARHDDAIPEYRKALELDPKLDEARFLFGRMLHHRGGHGKAITELRKVLDSPRAKSAPWFPEVWLNIGIAQEAQGKHSDAIASLKKATAIDPKLGEAWAQMGKFHGNLNKHGEAIAALTKAIEIGTKDDFWYADALMNLARAQVKSGKKGAAKKSLAEFLKVASPENTSRAEAERMLAGL